LRHVPGFTSSRVFSGVPDDPSSLELVRNVYPVHVRSYSDSDDPGRMWDKMGSDRRGAHHRTRDSFAPAKRDDLLTKRCVFLKMSVFRQTLECLPRDRFRKKGVRDVLEGSRRFVPDIIAMSQPRVCRSHVIIFVGDPRTRGCDIKCHRLFARDPSRTFDRVFFYACNADDEAWPRRLRGDHRH